jgi:hypothetical protein
VQHRSTSSVLSRINSKLAFEIYNIEVEDETVAARHHPTKNDTRWKL